MEPQYIQYSRKNSTQGIIQSLFWNKKGLFVLSVVFFLAIYVYTFLHRPPNDFPLGQVITIESGESLQDITTTLHNVNVIRSPFAFRTTVILLGGETKVKAGDYLFDRREGPADIAYRLVNGVFRLEVTKITIPEGWSTSEIAEYLEDTLINFNKRHFLTLAQKKEGYLFPDTYFVSPAAKPEKVIELMENTFENRIKTVQGMATTTRSLKDIMIMASILEEEAKTTESRRMVAGILWKRLAMGMPLQVDASFLYINGKNTYELTVDDLRIDSPYNTYLYKGLPPTPISNPGLDSIFAAVNPIQSKYLYYLSSKSGDMYYASTFEQHKKNRELYLNR